MPSERPSPSPSPPDPGAITARERVAAPDGAVAWRVLYHSRSVRGADIEVSGLIVAPAGDPPPGGFPVIAYAHGTTGLADRCAPSRQARTIRDDAVGEDALGSLPIPPLWEQGFVVAATDYEGLGTPGRHPYLVGPSEGRGVLDSIRAARALEPGLAGSRAIVVGISQGGHAALFAGEIAPEYAPDANLAGVVALAPAAELEQAAMLLLGDPSVVGFAVAIAAGFAAATPDADLARLLTPAALARLDVLDDGCIDDVLETFAGPIERVLRVERLAEEPWAGMLRDTTPGRLPTAVPVFVGQGEADALVVPQLTDALVARLCAIGTDVTYRRYPGASHGSVMDAAADDVGSWIADRLAEREREAPGDCPG